MDHDRCTVFTIHNDIELLLRSTHGYQQTKHSTCHDMSCSICTLTGMSQAIKLCPLTLSTFRHIGASL